MTVTKKSNSKQAYLAPVLVPRWRYYVVAVALLMLLLALIVHLINLQILPSNDRGFQFLQDQGTARTLRAEPILGYRGAISDRNGEPLAVSTPLLSLSVNPQTLFEHRDRWQELASASGYSLGELTEKLNRYRDKYYMSLSSRRPPEEAQEILDLKIPGVYSQQEFRRFYPSSEVSAHLLGITDVHDKGQEGIELAYDSYLAGENGQRHVEKDLYDQVIREVGLVKSATAGKNLTLSIDLRLQYLAYKELKAAVQKNRASSGSAIVLDNHTGEVLALVNQPSFNPNDRSNIETGSVRNRALVDQFEPGSTIKPFSILAAMEAGIVNINSTIDTSPGYLHVGGKTFLDPVNYGVMDLTKVITKSSQVATTKIALKTGPQQIRDMYYRVGLGQLPGTGFPGEAVGLLPQYERWPKVTTANYSFGYGFTTSVLQLAQAYSVIANDGLKKPVSLLKVNSEPEAERVFSEQLASQMKSMLATVTQRGGTGSRAELENYSTAGKSGTAHLVGENGYADDRYRSLFAGFAPLENPRIVVVALISEPKTGQYFGGEVAAPVFKKITEAALRVLEVPPNKAISIQTAKKEKKSGGVS